MMKDVGREIAEGLESFASDLKKGKEIRGTRLERKADGTIVRTKNVVVIPKKKEDK